MRKNYVTLCWPMISKKAFLISFFLLIFPFIYLFQKSLTPGQVIWGHDTVLAHFPYFSVMHQCLQKESYIPAWSPYIFGGFPLALDPQSEAFYPPRRILLHFFPPEIALNLTFALHFFAAAFLFCCLLLYKSYSIALGCLGGVMYSLNGFILLKVHGGHLGFIQVYAYLPLAIISSELLFGKLWKRGIALFAITIYLCLSTGGPQFTYYLLWASGFHFLYKLILTREIRVIPKYIAVLLIALCLAAPSLYSGMLLKQTSLRAEKVPFKWGKEGGRLGLAEFVTLVIPGFSGEPTRGNYWVGPYINWAWDAGLSFGPILLFPLMFLLQWDKKQWLLFATIVFLFILGCGSRTPIYKYFYDYVPFWSNFRIPARVFFPGIFLCAFWVVRCLNIIEVKERHLWLGFIVLILLSLWGNSLIKAIDNPGFMKKSGTSLVLIKRVINESFARATIFWFALLGNLLFFIFHQKRWIFHWVLCLMVTGFNIYCWGDNIDLEKTLKNVYRQGRVYVVRFKYRGFYKPEEYRIQPHHIGGFGNEPQHYGFRSMGGYNPLIFKNFIRTTEKINGYSSGSIHPFLVSASVNKMESLGLKLWNVGYILHRDQKITRIPDAAPRVYLSIDERSMEDFRKEAPKPLPFSYQVYIARPGQSDPRLSGRFKKVFSEKGIRGSQFYFEGAFVDLNLKKPALLVYSEAYFPLWAVRVDGKKRELLKVNDFQLGVRVKPGDRRVHFYLNLTGLRSACALQALAAIFLICFLLYPPKKEEENIADHSVNSESDKQPEASPDPNIS
ncbi:hypothetical protein ACFL35_18420 [Candidatus Riflebacteria bacterium]